MLSSTSWWAGLHSFPPSLKADREPFAMPKIGAIGRALSRFIMVQASVSDRSQTVVIRLLIVTVLLVALVVLWLWLRPGSSQAGNEGEEQGEASAWLEGARPGWDDASLQVRQLAAVTGTVRALAGEPLAGARVCARASKRALVTEQLRCTKSDEAGRYHIAELEPGRYKLVASAPERQPARTKARLAAGGEQRVDLVLRPGGVEVRGRVFDIAGGPIAGALVTLSPDWLAGDPQDTAGLAISDDEGRFAAWVRRGNVQVGAFATGYAFGRLYSSAPGPSIEIYLVPETVLVGRVIDAETGEPLAGVDVRPGHGDQVDTIWMTVDHGWTTSDEQGRFRIAGLSPGAFRPSVAHRQWRGVAERTVHLGLGETSAPIDIPVERARVVRISMVDSRDGQPACANGIVSLSPVLFESYVGSFDDAGVAELGGLLPGRFRSAVSCRSRELDDYPDVEVPDDPEGVEVEVTWDFTPGAALRGTVLGSDGQPLAGVVVLAERIAEGDDESGSWSRRSRSEASDAEGAFAIEGLEPGRYELQLTGMATPRMAEVVEVELGESDREGIRLQAGVSAQLIGRIIDEHGTPVPRLVVSASPSMGDTRQTHSDELGRFAFTGLGADSYLIQAVDGRWNLQLATRELELTTGQREELEIEVPSHDGTIHGRVVDEGGTALDDAFIFVERQVGPNEEDQTAKRLTYADAKGRPVLSDSDGSFELNGLPEGLYTVAARQHQGGAAQLVDVRPGARIELVVPTPASVAGVVVAPGIDLAAVEFSVTAELADESFKFADRWRSRSGEWRIDELPPGSYVITACSLAGDARLEVELAPGAELKDLRLELEPRVLVRGRVLDGVDGWPIADARIQAYSSRLPWMGGPGGVEAVRSDAEGRFSLRLPTGEVMLKVRPPGSEASWRHQAVKETITVRAPAEGDAFELEAIALEAL